MVPKSGATFRLEELQGYVGGYISTVLCPASSSLLVVNDDGLIHGLPENDAASRFAGRRIVGDVVLCKPEELD